MSDYQRAHRKAEVALWTFWVGSSVLGAVALYGTWLLLDVDFGSAFLVGLLVWFFAACVSGVVWLDLRDTADRLRPTERKEKHGE